MKTLWDRRVAREIEERLRRVSPERLPRWGSISAPQMMAHLADGVRLALGELPSRARPGLLRRWPIKAIVVYLLPMPRGAITVAELWQTAPQQWHDDLSRLIQLMRRVRQCADDPSHDWPDHPLFGRLSRRAWGVLGFRHFDHHLQQFGE